MIAANIAIVLFITACYVICMYKRRAQLSGMEGMVATMAVAAASSTALGLTLSIVCLHDLTLATVIAVTAGMAAGFLLGKPVGLLAAIEGMASGMMGGLMGPMLGVMLEVPILLIGFMDAVLVLTVAAVQGLLYRNGDVVQSSNMKV
ncbi:hypothetical protein [Brevibacillus massiliensis]|uniref:hypothetical protein n=1 Tax=Brevibacillus massiliensis TaxID=1118054 RepID=UPI0003140815|nr:hypothetical protein [Brevibacillus massiliensis]